MNQIQIDVFQSELFQLMLDHFRRRSGFLVMISQFGSDEKVGALEFFIFNRVADRFTDGIFVLVMKSRVEMTVAVFYRLSKLKFINFFADFEVSEIMEVIFYVACRFII